MASFAASAASAMTSSAQKRRKIYVNDMLDSQDLFSSATVAPLRALRHRGSHCPRRCEMDALQSKGYDTAERMHRGFDGHHTSYIPKNKGLRKVSWKQQSLLSLRKLARISQSRPFFSTAGRNLEV